MLSSQKPYTANIVALPTGNQEDEERTRSSTGTGSSTRAGARAGAREAIEAAYFDVLGAEMPGVIWAQLSRLQLDGEVVIEALIETAAAPRPSWRYCWAILSRCAAEGVRTMEDWRRRQLAHQERPKPAKQGEYHQRQYPDGYFDQFFSDLGK